jgi:endonuclease YncB( thermonuclease family)
MILLFFFLFVASLISLIVGLIKPNAFKKIFKQTLSRKKLSAIFGITAIVCIVGMGFTADDVPKNTENKAEEKTINANIDNVELVQENTNSTEEQTSTTPENTNQNDEQDNQNNNSPLYLVTSVVDGDTIKVNIDGVTKTLRLIGIDTPETVDPRKPVQCFGVEASNRTKQLLLNKKVRLEADPTQGELDKYNRLLRYVYLEDGTSFNKKMISDGYAYEYTYNTPYKYHAEFKKAQIDAKNSKLGLWADDACTTQTTTPPPTNTAPPVVPPSDATETSTYNCSSDTYNCVNFKTHAEAQAVYDYCFSKVGKDIHKLDGSDKDGVACESLR